VAVGTVIVTDGENRSALAVCRSLSARGHRVVVVARSPRCLSGRSRAVARTCTGPHPGKDGAGFAGLMRALALEERADLVVPISDHALIALDQYREQLAGIAPVALAGHEAVRGVVDKRRNLDLAARLGLPVPREFRLESRRQVDDMVQYLGWPIVLKRPGVSHDASSHELRFRVLFARDRASLDRYLDLHCADGRFPLFQEYADGIAVNVVCFAVKGEVVAAHQYRSLRTYSGSGVLRQVIDAEADLAAHARRILGALAWDGVAHVGFFVNREANRAWYMEVNGRFWASVQGSVDAGWDFPAWTYDYFVNGERPDPPPLRVGSRTCWHMGDWLSLVEYLRGGESPTPGARPSALRAVADWASGFGPGIRSDTFRWSDPWPAVGEVVDYGRRLRVGLRRRAGVTAG
jgi:predicted ATP-grasp superfamily ATP-dependent carboligase